MLYLINILAKLLYNCQRYFGEDRNREREREWGVVWNYRGGHSQSDKVKVSE